MERAADVTSLLHPYPSSTRGLIGPGEIEETDWAGSRAGSGLLGPSALWPGAWGRGGEPTSRLAFQVEGRAGRAGTHGEQLAASWGRVHGTGNQEGKGGWVSCPRSGACRELLALCLHSLPKKSSPPPAATAKSQFSLRRRQAPRGKSSPVLKKTPTKGLMQLARHRPCCLPPSRAHLPSKEGMRTGRRLLGRSGSGKP